MISRAELCKTIAGYAESVGVGLYDVDMPTGANGVLRVYVCNPEKHSSAVSIQDCARVSRLISASPELDTFLHQYQLEVSSPGVNRRLREVEHFIGAVGERIKVSMRSSGKKDSTIVGILKKFVDETFVIEQDAGSSESETELELSFNDVKNAHVDFAF